MTTQKQTLDALMELITKVNPEEEVKVIDLTSKAEKAFDYYVEIDPQCGSGFGVNHDYFKVGQEQMMEYAMRHDCEDDGERRFGTNASRLARNLMYSKDRQQHFALEQLQKTLNKNAYNPIEGDTEIPIEKRARREQYERDMEEQVAIARSDYLGALEVYNAVSGWDNYKSISEKQNPDARPNAEYVQIQTDRLDRLQAL